MSSPLNPSPLPTSSSSSPREGFAADTGLDHSHGANGHRRTVSGSATIRSGTCEDVLDIDDTKRKPARESLLDDSRLRFNANGGKQGVKRITESGNISLEGFVDDLLHSQHCASPTLSPSSSRAQSPGITTMTATTSTSPISEASTTTRTQEGSKPLFSLPQSSENPQGVLSFTSTGIVQAKNTPSPTPSLCGSKFTPLKRVKKGTAASANNSLPSTPDGAHTHTKRTSITSSTTEVASTGPGSVDAADYGIHGKKLATMYSNPATDTVPYNNNEVGEVAPALVLLHISLIIPPNSSPAYARHQRRMQRRKRLEDDSSTFSISDLGCSDDESTRDDADSDSLEPGPLSILSPVVYQRGILIPHPRGDYVLLQREVGKTLGLPFVNGEDGENVITDEFGGVQGKGWQMRVYARNGWLTKGAWERAWREMERVDVEILETEKPGTKQKKPNSRTTKAQQSQNPTTRPVSRSGSHIQDSRSRPNEGPSRLPLTNSATGEEIGDTLAPEDTYSDPGDSLDESSPQGNVLGDNDTLDQGEVGNSFFKDEIVDGAGAKNLEFSDIDDIEVDVATPFYSQTPPIGQGIKRAPLQLENGTVGDGELEEAYRIHGEDLDAPDEEYDNHSREMDQTPPSQTGSMRSHSPLPSRSSSPNSSKHHQAGSTSTVNFLPGRRKVHPYQYLLDLLKPIVLTGLVVTCAMYFFGPTHKRNNRGRYGSWNMRGVSKMHTDEENFDMDQDAEDHCASYARDAEMWRSWKDSHKDGISSGGSSKKGVHGDWTVTVTQTVTQRIVNAGATQIVVEIPSGEAQFPLGPLGLSERDSLGSEGLPLETTFDGPVSTPMPTLSVEANAAGESKEVGGEDSIGEDDKDLDVAHEKVGEDASTPDVDAEEVVFEDPTTNSNWFGKIGKIF